MREQKKMKKEKERKEEEQARFKNKISVFRGRHMRSGVIEGRADGRRENGQSIERHRGEGETRS